jgi:hypothetical protein
MARVTPDQYVEKHARRLKGALPDMEAGIDRVTSAPTAAAAAKKEKMRSNITAALDSGKWERGLRRVSLEEWKDKMKRKGLGRVATGVDEAAQKVRSFAADLLPFEDGLKGTVDKMPDTTLEDSINRMVAWTRGMAKFSRKS